MVSGLSPETGCRKYIQAGVVKDTSSAISKSDLLASILLLLVSKSDFLVADEVASFSRDLSTLRRTPAWPSATVPRPSHSKRNNFLKSFQERCIFRPLSRVLWVEGSFFSLGGRLIGSSRGVARAPRTLTMCVSGRGEGVSKGGPLLQTGSSHSKLARLKPCEGALYFEQSHGTGMHVGIEVVTEGSPLEMGSAEGESLRKKVRSSPTCSRSCTVFGCCSHLDVLSVVPPVSESRAKRFLET